MSPSRPGDRSRTRPLSLLISLLVALAPAALAAPASAVELPTVTTGVATDVTGTGASLNAIVDPVDNESAEYGFEYGRDAGYGNTTATVLLPKPYAGPVQLKIVDLTPGAVYHFRAFARNSGGTVYGADASFTATPPAVNATAPTVSALAPTKASTTGITLNAKVNPGGDTTTVRFEWGPTANYGKVVEQVIEGAATVDVLRSATLTGLTTGTTYHLRITVSNRAGSSSTKDILFMAGRGLTKLVAATSAPTIAWGGRVGFEGRLHGAVPNGVRLEILRNDYPYKGGWKRIATTTTLDDGTWGTRLEGIYTSTKLRARVLDDTTVYSNLVKLGAQLQVVLKRGHVGRSAVQVRGAVYPVARRARIVLQRLVGNDRWVNVHTIRGARAKHGRVAFKATLQRAKHDERYRAYVRPGDDAHAVTGSVAITVPGR